MNTPSLASDHFEAGVAALGQITRPRSVAIVGASPDQAKLAGRTLPNLLRYGFKGRIFPVNPAYQELSGLRCYASIADLPEIPETAFVVVPAASVVDVLGQLAESGVPTATVVASGFGEDGSAEASARGRDLSAVLRTRPLRILGPNSIGTIDVESGAVLRATTNLPAEFIAGQVGVATQSGALSLILLHLLHRRGLGVNQVIPVGNEVDLGVAEAVRHLTRLPGCRAVIMFLESIREAGRLARAAAEADRQGVRLIALTVGASRLGQQISQAHTAALASDHRLVSSLLRDLGIVLVASPAEAVEAARLALLSAGAPVRRPGLGLVCFSGGESAMLADLANETGVELPQPSGTAAKLLSDRFRFSSPANPFDVTADALTHPELFRSAHEAFRLDQRVGRVAFVLPPLTRFDRERVHTVIDGIREKDPAAVVVQWPTADDDSIRSHVFTESDSLLRAHRALASAERHSRPAAIAGVLRRAAETPAAGLLDDHEVRRRLRLVGLEWCREAWLDSEAAVAVACSQVPGPWVLKGSVNGVTHKSDWGGVRLRLEDPDEVRVAYQAMEFAAESAWPGAWQGAWLQECVDGVEALVAVIRDPRLGSFAAVGRGGIDVESEAEVEFIPFPVEVSRVLDLLQGGSLEQRTSGSRGRAQASLPMVAKSAQLLSGLFADPAIRLAEVNPLILVRSTQRAVAVDARIIGSERRPR